MTDDRIAVLQLLSNLLKYVNEMTRPHQVSLQMTLCKAPVSPRREKHTPLSSSPPRDETVWGRGVYVGGGALHLLTLSCLSSMHSLIYPH